MGNSEPVFDRILIIDDNTSIQEDFRRIFCRRADERTYLELTTALFGHKKPVATQKQAPIDSVNQPKEKFRVDFATQGIEGAELVARALDEGDPYAMAFVDIRMPPGIDGVETTLKLWELDPGLQVVICTLYSDYHWEQTKHRLGRTDRLLVLKKPFDGIEVLQLASSLTRKRQLDFRANLRDCELKMIVEERTTALRTLAETDSLTKLFNRTAFLDRLQKRLDECRGRDELHTAVLFLDLDSFKLVNDSLGHEAGDKMLIEISNRIREVCRRRNAALVSCEKLIGVDSGAGRRPNPSPDPIRDPLSNSPSDREPEPTDQSTIPARLGGDEFAILAAEISDLESAETLGRELIAAVNRPIEWSDRKLFAGVSVGTSLVRGGGEAIDVLRESDTAMYDAKMRGRNQISVFDEAMLRKRTNRLSVESGIRRALETEEFSIYVQPIRRLSDGSIDGYETLTRWMGPDGPVLTPDEFIPVAEENGQILDIGQWVLDSAMSLAGSYCDDDRTTKLGHLTINISRRQLIAPGFVESVVDALDRHNVPPHWFGIEITETAVVETHHTIFDQLSRLRGMGFRIYLDDFGKGTSSLSFLNHFPIDILKIDRSFVINETESGTAILEAIVMMAKALGIEVVAEGIETEEQRDRLARLGCTYGQGYGLGRPQPPDDWLGAPRDPSRKRSRRQGTVLSPVPDQKLRLPEARNGETVS